MARTGDPHAKIDLLRAAEAVFVARGLDQAKVEEITVRAGRSKGAFYLHFRSKEDAFRQIVETMLARLAACIDDGSPWHDAFAVPDPEEMLARWREKDLAIFEFAWQNRGVMRLLFEGGRSANFGYLIDEFAERHRRQTVANLAAGVQRGIFRAGLDVEMASRVVGGAYDQVARWVVRSPRRPDLVRIAADLQRVLLGGLAGAALARLISDSPVKKPRPRRRA